MKIVVMEIESLRTYCLSLPGTTEGMKWGEHLTFMVAEKMYAIFGLDQVPINASFKVSDEDFEIISQRAGMKPAPYMARNKWIAVEDISLIGEKEWKNILNNSYKIVKSKLPKKKQAEIDNISSK